MFDLDVGIVQTTNGFIDIAHSLCVGEPGLSIPLGVDVFGQKPGNVVDERKFKNQGRAQQCM
jgi:hypothetical protein